MRPSRKRIDTFVGKWEKLEQSPLPEKISGSPLPKTHARIQEGIEKEGKEKEYGH
jgi:hypothetical protein